MAGIITPGTQLLTAGSLRAPRPSQRASLSHPTNAPLCYPTKYPSSGKFRYTTKYYTHSLRASVFDTWLFPKPRSTFSPTKASYSVSQPLARCLNVHPI
jgi:hypothetical protein